VEGDGRIRLFCALRLPEHVLDWVVGWQEAHLSASRIVPRENLHITLAFLGHRPESELPAIVDSLRATAARAPRLELVVRRYRETPRVGMLVLDDSGNVAETPAVAHDLHRRLEALGIPLKERGVWTPHLTVLRFRDRPRLQPPLPDLGAFSPSDAAVYRSVLRSGGAQYEVLESVALGGKKRWIASKLSTRH
jgi:2'-5' RNA ligase